MRIDTQADVEAATARLAGRSPEALARFIVSLAQDGGPVGEHVRRFVVADDPRAIADALRAGIQAIGADRAPVAGSGAEVGARMEWILDGIESWVLPSAAGEAFNLLVELIERDGPAMEACGDHHFEVNRALERAAGALADVVPALPKEEIAARLQRLLAADEYGTRTSLGVLVRAVAGGG